MQYLGLLLACAASAHAVKLGIGQELFTTNAVCSKTNCVNPVFPGLEDLHTLAHSHWQCSSLHKVADSMSFCRPLINYDPALPAGTGKSIEELAKTQDGEAATAFFYHLSGLGLEGWDHQQPELSDNDCIKAIWRLSCFTYFPRAQMGCVDGGTSLYLRPCQSSCMNYQRQCGVECCDESVQCVFTHEKVLGDGAVVMTEGYAPHEGPSSLCTGGAHRTARSSLLAFGLPALVFMLLEIFQGGNTQASSPAPSSRCRSRAVASSVVSIARGVGRSLFKSAFLPALLIAITLQGCALDPAALDVPEHTVGNWRAEPDYLVQWEYIPPGGMPTDALVNSCSLTHLAQTLQCSGKGVCKYWHREGMMSEHKTAFCECDRDYADPECRTKRKSQAAAFSLSLFFGMFGADLYYMGYPASAALKLFSLGGCGIWWVYDVIKIGSGPAKTPNFRLAADLPHWVFALMTVMTAILLGFTYAYFGAISYRARRRKDALQLQAEEAQYYDDPTPSPQKQSAFTAP